MFGVTNLDDMPDIPGVICCQGIRVSTQLSLYLFLQDLPTLVYLLLQTSRLRFTIGRLAGFLLHT